MKQVFIFRELRYYTSRQLREFFTRKGERYMSSGNEKICNITDPTKVSAMSVEALVTCRKCGAKAHDPASVCDPVQFPVAGVLGD